MQALPNVGLPDVQAVYSGPEGRLWELVMGEQIHVGGLSSSMELSEKAGICEGTSGVDLCCGSGGGMRFLVRFRKVARMLGVDATVSMIDRGRRRCQEESLSDSVTLALAEATVTGLPSNEADFVWGEDAWCYVVDKQRLIAEAVRLVKHGGILAFTDWMIGPVGLTDDEAERLLRIMTFPNIEDLDGYRSMLTANDCQVLVANDTGRLTGCLDLYLRMLRTQHAYDALKIVGFDHAVLDRFVAGLAYLQELAHAGKIVQGRFVARKNA